MEEITRLKIVQINSVYGEKSTGRTCLEVEKAILKAGGDCVTAYGFGRRYNDNPHTYKIGTKAEYYFHNVMGRITGLCGYFSVFSTLRLIHFLKKYDPDLIHLRNLHAFYVNLPILFHYLKKCGKPVVLNVHDCWIFTGKCTHYTVNYCDKWKTECRHCPRAVIKQYPQSLLFDRGRIMFKHKKKWLSELPDLTVVGVSDWTAEQVRMSFLKDHRVLRIYNWVDFDKFSPSDENVLAEYGLDAEKFTVICAGAGWSPSSTKYQDLQKLIYAVGEEMQFMIVGTCSDTIQADNVRYTGYVSDIGRLAKLYSSCDVYVHLSLEDTFGKVIAEALSCGTPAVVYDSTACPEIVDKGCGYVVKPHDIEGIKAALMELKTRGKRSMKAACRERVLDCFNYEKNSRELIDLYAELIGAEGNHQ